MSGASMLPSGAPHGAPPPITSPISSVQSQAAPPGVMMGTMLWGQPQPFQAFLHAATAPPGAPPSAFVAAPGGYPPPSAPAHHAGAPFPHQAPPLSHPPALPPGYVASPPPRGGFFAPVPPPHHPLAPHPHAHPLPPHHSLPHAMGLNPGAWPSAPPPGAAVYDVKAIERHIHQLLRGGPIQDEQHAAGQEAPYNDAAPVMHLATDVELLAATADRAEADQGPFTNDVVAQQRRRHGATGEEDEQEEDGEEADGNDNDNGTSRPADTTVQATGVNGYAAETSNGHASPAHATSSVGGTTTAAGRNPRGRGRRERRNSNAAVSGAAGGRQRSGSGKAAGGRAHGSQSSANGDAAAGASATDGGATTSTTPTTATSSAGERGDGRRPRGPAGSSRQGKQTTGAAGNNGKFNNRQRTAGNGTTAPVTSHRRLPPPEVLGLAPAAAPATTPATEEEEEGSANGHNAPGGRPAGKQQWIAKTTATKAEPTETTATPEEGSASAPVPVRISLPPREKLARVELEREKRAKIAKDMLVVFEGLRPSEEEMQAKLDLVKRLQRIVGPLWPGFQAKLNLFGSSANGFCLKNSDLDICMTIDKRAGTKKKIVNRIARTLRDHKMKDVTALSHASVPIVKFEDPSSKFSCDICINNILALHNTHMIAQYSRIDSRLLQLGYFIKFWAKRRKLDEPYTGTLSSYAWILLVINFLQQRNPPVLPCLQRVTPSGELRGEVPVLMLKGHNCYYYSDDIRRLRFRSQNQETLAGLLLDFFYLYAEEFDYEHQVVSVRRGTMLTKKEKRWDKMPKTVKENHWFSIEDPFDLTHDLGRVVDQDNLEAIKHEFRRAYSLLTSTHDLAEVCEQYISN